MTEPRVETAIRQYRDGEVSIGRASELADCSLWQFFDLLDGHEAQINYTETNLDADLAAVRNDD